MGNNANRYGVPIETIRQMARRSNARRWKIAQTGQWDGALMYYGKMPNTDKVGWYFVAWVNDIRCCDPDNASWN